MKAPDFNLPDQDGIQHTLSEFKGCWLIVYFYPRDDTPGCTKEACNFRDQSSEFKERCVEIIGISKDTVKSHKKFADKYNLNFLLLSDPDHTVIEAYGAWGKKKFMGREFTGIMRNTYLIDPTGEIIKEYTGVNPLTHSKELLADIDKAQQKTS